MPWQPSDAHRSGGWGRGGWGPPGGRRRPPWWPENEPWPPEGPEAWRRLRRRFASRAIVFAVVSLLVVAAVVSGLVWLVHLLSSSGVIGIFPGLIAVLLTALVLRWLVRGFRYATAPVGELIEAAGRVEEGQLGIQVPERGPSDVRRLTRSFNAMSERLAHTEEQRRRLLADVSHELRTPLTVIQGNVEGMLDGLYPADRAHLERVRAETLHLERLIDDLRTLSLAESGALPLHREPCDVGEVARQVVAGFDPQAVAAGVTLAADAPVDLPELSLDPRRVHQVIANLVSNALRHTPSGGRVSVSVRAQDGGAVLEVSDTGSGMSEEAVSHAFDRFWRSGAAAGAGLGLAIVRDLVAAHGGEVVMRSGVGAGTTVTATFPA
jgi:signal transduction histidine kinase